MKLWARYRFIRFAKRSYRKENIFTTSSSFISYTRIPILSKWSLLSLSGLFQPCFRYTPISVSYPTNFDSGNWTHYAFVIQTFFYDPSRLCWYLLYLQTLSTQILLKSSHTYHNIIQACHTRHFISIWSNSRIFR
jgi:hypothetical protein